MLVLQDVRVAQLALLDHQPYVDIFFHEVTAGEGQLFSGGAECLSDGPIVGVERENGDASMIDGIDFATITVAAVVLTYNRKELLRECLQALLSQIRAPDVIIVANNGSTDGTDQMLSAEFPQATEVRLTENIGAAGGLGEGLKYAYARGYDWLWLMDDDGKPAPETLAQLLDGARKWELDLAAPLVVDNAFPSKLAFPLELDGALVADADRVRREPILRDQANLYNGVLMRAKLIDVVGLPDVRLFIRGDEIEYNLRLVRKGVRRGVVTGATFYHPQNRGHLVFPACLFGARGRVGYSGQQWKDYFNFRNLAYINSHVKDRHAAVKSLIGSFVMYSIFFLLMRRLDIRGYLFWARATLDGVKGKFDDPKRIMAKFG